MRNEISRATTQLCLASSNTISVTINSGKYFWLITTLSFSIPELLPFDSKFTTKLTHAKNYAADQTADRGIILNTRRQLNNLIREFMLAISITNVIIHIVIPNTTLWMCGVCVWCVCAVTCSMCIGQFIASMCVLCNCRFWSIKSDLDELKCTPIFVRVRETACMYFFEIDVIVTWQIRTIIRILHSEDYSMEEHW